MEYIKLINDIHSELQFNRVKMLNEKTGQHCEYTEKIILTKLESEILYLVACGKSPPEISKYLTLSNKRQISGLTIAFIITNKIYHKFAVVTKSQLIDKAILLKLIPLIHENYI